MKNIIFNNIPDEVNTVEKTIDWLKKKFRNSEKFEVTIEENILGFDNTVYPVKCTNCAERFFVRKRDGRVSVDTFMSEIIKNINQIQF